METLYDGHMITVEEDIEYTCMGGYGNGIVMSCLTIRYLPAFENGFFEDDDKDATYENEENKVITTHTHSFGDWRTLNSTYHAVVCTCGETEIKEHSFGYGIITKEPTETSTGVKTFTCEICGATKTETIPKLEHTHTHSYGNWSDDGNDSTHSKTCSCGDTKNESHIWSSWVKYSAGQYRYCSQCGATQFEVDKTTPRDYYYQCVCNYCRHNDGAKHLVLENGVEVDVIWTCSACGRENWNYVTWSW